MQKPDSVIIGDGNMKVAVALEVIQQLKDLQEKHSFCKESGGIIVGYYENSLGGLKISDLTFPQAEDVRSRFRFIRKAVGHQDIMDELWEKSGHKKSYLGEWHTHNQTNPSPSPIDKLNWKKIAKREQYFDILYFAIVGTSKIGFWAIQNSMLKQVDMI